MASKSKKARKQSSRLWLDRHISDPYVHKAQQEGYRARSAYKLIELDDAERLLRPGITVVDLGSSPGAWSQVLARKVLGHAQGRGERVDAGPRRARAGRIIALDLLEMPPIPEIEFLQGDFREQQTLDDLQAALAGQPVDLVLSDMSPNLSGVAPADSARMADLIELALEFALANLTDNGILVAKTFHGSGFSQQVQQMKAAFVSVKERKPAASRSESAETYLIARVLKGRRDPGSAASK